jgi:hypothetical protein
LKKKSNQNNGRERLEEAMAMLIQNEAAFVGRLSAADERFARMDQRFAQIDQRFARMEADLETVLRVLTEHGQMLEALPQAVRDKIGFRTEPAPE